MRAVQLTGIRQMALRTVPDPLIRRADDVLSYMSLAWISLSA